MHFKLLLASYDDNIDVSKPIIFAEGHLTTNAIKLTEFHAPSSHLGAVNLRIFW